jgi:hypothetical protein
MVFWVGILVAALFVWFAIRIGFYEMWAMLFNIVVSIYLAVFLRPVIVEIVPAAGSTPYSDALTLLATAAASFVVLYGISYIYFTGQFSVSFPRVFNIIAAGFLGFLAGFLVWSFACLLICTTPMSQQPLVKGLGFDSQSQQANVSYMSWWCNLVHKVVASEGSRTTSEEAISKLLESTEKKTGDRAPEETERNKPVGVDVEGI